MKMENNLPDTPRVSIFPMAIVHPDIVISSSLFILYVTLDRERVVDYFEYFRIPQHFFKMSSFIDI